MSRQKGERKSEGRKRDGRPKYAVKITGYWIQDPNGKPGEKIFVDKLPPDEEEALGNLIFESFKPLLLKHVAAYLKLACLEPSDFCDESWARFVRAAHKLIFVTRGTTCEEEEMTKLSDVLKEVLSKKLAATEAKNKRQ